jgi:hypothetical protein
MRAKNCPGHRVSTGTRAGCSVLRANIRGHSTSRLGQGLPVSGSLTLITGRGAIGQRGFGLSEQRSYDSNINYFFCYFFCSSRM